MAWVDEDGKVYNKKDSTLTQGEEAAAGAAGKAGGLLLLLPGLLVIVFELIFDLLFKWKRVGRAIQAVMMGVIIGLALLICVGSWLMTLPGILFVILGTACFALPTAWYYYSHYFTLKAIMHDSERLGIEYKEMFIVPFAIMFYGIVFLGVCHLLSYLTNSRGIPGWVYLIPCIIAVLLYIKNSLFGGVLDGAKILKEEEGYPPIGAIVAVAVTCILPFMALSSTAAHRAEYAKEKKSHAEAVANLAGKPLVVGSSVTAINLRAEPSGASKALKALKGNDTITAIGNVSGLWVPVELGGDKGYVFAMALTLNGKPIFNEFPYDATASAPVQLYVSLDKAADAKKAHVVPKGGMVTVESINTYSNSIDIEDNNAQYSIHLDAAENLVPKLNEAGSVVTVPLGAPNEFKKGSRVTVTKDINARIYRFQQYSIMSIPAGTTYDVKMSLNFTISTETSDGTNVKIYKKYLKPAD